MVHNCGIGTTVFAAEQWEKMLLPLRIFRSEIHVLAPVADKNHPKF